MLPNQSAPSAQTGTEDRTALYRAEAESGSANAAEGIDPPVDSLPPLTAESLLTAVCVCFRLALGMAVLASAAAWDSDPKKGSL